MKHVTAHWETAILVCAKCSRKLGGGFGDKGRTSLAKALRVLGNGKKGRKADFGVVESKCLKVCPKGAVVAVNMARPRDWLVVPQGTDIEIVVAQLALRPSKAPI